jgi:predicted transcriptional regulator
MELKKDDKIRDIESEIKEILTTNNSGLTIQDISEKVKTSRNTVVKILAKFEGMGILEIREIGQAKLHYLKINGELR